VIGIRYPSDDEICEIISGWSQWLSVVYHFTCLSPWRFWTQGSKL